MINIKRIYDKPSADDGIRIFVDKIWPRGMTKEKAKIDLWLKKIAPSDVLRKWFAHDPKKWEAFKKKYFKELKDEPESVNLIAHKARRYRVTLLYGAKEIAHNNAVALKEYLVNERKRK